MHARVSCSKTNIQAVDRGYYTFNVFYSVTGSRYGKQDYFTAYACHCSRDGKYTYMIFFFVLPIKHVTT